MDIPLVESFYHLYYLQCTPYHYHDKAVLLGDAAHAMLPLYGQGVNCVSWCKQRKQKDKQTDREEKGL